MTEIRHLDGAALAARYSDGALSPREVVADSLARIAAHEPAINAFVLVDAEAALARAAESEARWRAGTPRGPLDGIPVTIKDNIAWAGHPMRRGSPTTSPEPLAASAPATERLLEAGAIPLGKTTMPEFGWKGLGDSTLTGPTRNPWDLSRTTGGSSAGAAAAAALDLGLAHLGTDGAGSIRIPAAFCGVFGLKPSYGRVPAYPPSPFGPVAHLGPLARRVSDAALMLRAIARPDARDMLAWLSEPPDYAAGLAAGVRGLRIAWSPRLGYAARVDPEVEALTARAASAFAELGATVEEADPGFADPVETLNGIWLVGAWSVLRTIPEAQRGAVEPALRAAAERGSRISAPDFLAALNARAAIFTAMARFHARYDLLLTPAVAVPALPVGRLTPADGSEGDDWLAWTPFSYPFNLTGQPAASVPCGLSAAGLPVGLQIVGPMGEDARVLAAARAFEAARPWPAIEAPRPAP
ncbi:Amidase [Methylobacterium sp. 4-46]|uniref:amidase n=1 Tax=unclassified Methylobacterium TaxID=2615210 RepID=UPI000152D883|nr:MULTISPECIES: amidase [Methylobacterium]ACA17565.1 Amidase [Methylobacterium sp. 4-46]WFT83242.1 amidase [Methylobacterium nodulans]